MSSMMSNMASSMLCGFKEEHNVLFEFFKNGKLIGREIRDEGIIEAYDGIKGAAEHLVGFYNERGRINVKVFYKNKESEYELVK